MRSTGAAELQFELAGPSIGESDPARDMQSAAELKRQVAERLAAHRSRRGQMVEGNLIALAKASSSNHPAERTFTRPAKGRASRVAAAVALRYADSPSYRDFLAAEAERAIERANAEAEVAARNAEAVTAIQQQFLAELNLWDEIASAPGPLPLQISADPLRVATRPAREVPESPSAPSPNSQPSSQSSAQGISVRLYEDVGLRQPEPRVATSRILSEDEAYLLDELDAEIAFRQTPIFETTAPPIPIPANLIEFPRQLVAPRKSRPRRAEGPLREEADTTPAAAQLRIFEVEANQISTATGSETVLPEWSSIYLDTAPGNYLDTTAAPGSTVGSPAEDATDGQVHTQLYVPFQIAPLSHRLMAAAVDACLLGVAFLAAVTAFAFAVKSLPGAAVALIASAGLLLVLFVLYHLLFFTFSDSTPGMRYARIGLCTFSDDNPTRAGMRYRTWSILLALFPLGLGLLWTFLDEDGLGWHDRLSRMYQRSY